MADTNFRVLVVDDDFMIAKMHGKYIASQKGFTLAGLAYSYEHALSQVIDVQPDLLLLDVYLPDDSGIELLHTIRSRKIPCDVILITAAKEREVVEEGFRLGIFDYLFKPFNLEHLQDILVKYALFKARLSSSNLWNQELLDDLKKLRSPNPSVLPLEKGIDNRTLERIKQFLVVVKEYQTVEQIAQKAGVSRTTVRRYLTHLVEENTVEEFLQYGTIGRPLRLYRMKY